MAKTRKIYPKNPQKGDLLPFHRALLAWFEENRRDFFWRGENPGVFAILLSEILLQRTPADRVDAVIRQLLVQYPTAKALGEAPLADLETFLQPLGLFRRRAKVLHQLAEDLTKQYRGRVPRAYDKLEKLHGVGDYIARAVRCFGFGYREPIVDVNVIRIFERVFSVQVHDPAKDPRRNPHLLEFAEEMLPPGRQYIKQYNWALLDHGALVCTPANPKCEDCPIKEYCDFFRE